MKLKKPQNLSPTTGDNILDSLLQISSDVKDACDELATVAVDCASKKDKLKRAEAKALLNNRNNGKSQEIRAAFADAEFADERLEFYKVEARKEVLVETIKTLRQILSAHQTYVSSQKSVAELLGYGQTKD